MWSLLTLMPYLTDLYHPCLVSCAGERLFILHQIEKTNGKRTESFFFKIVATDQQAVSETAAVLIIATTKKKKKKDTPGQGYVLGTEFTFSVASREVLTWP